MPIEYLHNHKQFPELIRIVAEQEGIDPALSAPKAAEPEPLSMVGSENSSLTLVRSWVCRARNEIHLVNQRKEKVL
jgi:hypothetical protein